MVQKKSVSGVFVVRMFSQEGVRCSYFFKERLFVVRIFVFVVLWALVQAKRECVPSVALLQRNGEFEQCKREGGNQFACRPHFRCHGALSREKVDWKGSVFQWCHLYGYYADNGNNCYSRIGLRVSILPLLFLMFDFKIDAKRQKYTGFPKVVELLFFFFRKNVKFPIIMASAKFLK